MSNVACPRTRWRCACTGAATEAVRRQAIVDFFNAVQGRARAGEGGHELDEAGQQFWQRDLPKLLKQKFPFALDPEEAEEG